MDGKVHKPKHSLLVYPQRLCNLASLRGHAWLNLGRKSKVRLTMPALKALRNPRHKVQASDGIRWKEIIFNKGSKGIKIGYLVPNFLTEVHLTKSMSFHLGTSPQKWQLYSNKSMAWILAWIIWLAAIFPEMNRSGGGWRCLQWLAEESFVQKLGE